jgi:hypothetical protein
MRLSRIMNRILRFSAFAMIIVDTFVLGTLQ